MFSLFAKKYWSNFYLPSDIKYQLSEVNSNKIKSFLNSKKIKFRTIKCNRISEHLFYISISFTTECELLKFDKYIKQFKEMIPPWFAFPDILQGSPRWNQGYQEDYCINNWLPYWESMNKIEKENYLFKYDCPHEWRSWFVDNKML